MNKKLLIIIALALILTVSCCIVACDDDEVPSGGSGSEPSGTIELSLDKSSLTLEMGQSAMIIATVSGTNSVPAWTSSAPAVATVNNGRVTAVSDGTATITATLGEQSATCAVTVSSRETVSIDRESLRLFKDESVKLSAVVKKGLIEQDEIVSWTSEDDEYVSVDADGVVTGNKITKNRKDSEDASVPYVKVIATSASGQTAVCEVKVEKVVQITLSATDVTLHPNGANTANITVSGKSGKLNLTASSVTWESSDESIVGVKYDEKTSSAVLTAKKSGNVTVTATVADSSEVAVINVESWYAISTPDDMDYLASDTQGVFKLVNDIDFQGAQFSGITKWVGDNVPETTYFGGILDGQGYAIKNINLTAGWNMGIIGQTNTHSIVRNLSVINLVNADTSNKVGSIVSFNRGLIENCYIEHTIQNDGPTNWNSHGGIVATNAQTGIIRNCIVKITAARTYNNCGALIGYNCGEVNNCYAICTDATLPMYCEWSTTLGSFTDCGVFTSEDAFIEGAQLHVYSDKVWHKTGMAVPALNHYPEVSFDNPTMYFAQGSRYTVAPANLRGVVMDWEVVGNDSNIVSVEENDDHSLAFFARTKGTVTLNVALYNGSTASVNIVVTGTVLVANEESVAIDYNNPALTDTDVIILKDEAGNLIDTDLSYESSDPNVATVSADGVITARGAGQCTVSIRYIEDDYIDFIKVSVTGWSQISTAEEFQGMKNNISLNYCLVNDIDFGGNTFETITPYVYLAPDSSFFNGIFDGNGYTVSNVKVVGNDRGIWGQTATTAIIRNANFVNIEFCPVAGKTEQQTCGVVSFNTGTIQNIVVRAKFNAGHSVSYKPGGGVCGTNEYRGRVYNCISYVDVSDVPGDSKIFLGIIMGLCQGVAKDCIGIMSGSTSCTVQAISYINSNSVVSCKMYKTEDAAISDYAPFGSFSTDVWEVSSDTLPTLKHLF